MGKVAELKNVIESGKEIASTILSQLGNNKFIVMTGAKNMAHGDDYLSFKIGKNAGGVTHVKIRLDQGKDAYDMTFYKLRGSDLKTVKEYKGVYADQLKELFTEVTGMNTNL